MISVFSSPHSVHLYVFFPVSLQLASFVVFPVSHLCVREVSGSVSVISSVSVVNSVSVSVIISVSFSVIFSLSVSVSLSFG